MSSSDSNTAIVVNTAAEAATATPIWQTPATAAELNASLRNTLAEHLGIVIVEVGPDYLKASMPVDHRTRQSRGILNGGASAALAETIGGMAAQMCLSSGHCVGLDINTSHLRVARDGLVYALARPVHVGRSTQVWSIHTSDREGRSVALSRLTLAVLQ